MTLKNTAVYHISRATTKLT